MVRRDHFRREPYPLGARGPRARVTARQPARSRMPANMDGITRGSDGDAHATTQDAREDVACSQAAPPSDLGNENARRRCRRGLQDFRDDVTLPVICPTSQTWRDCGKQNLRDDGRRACSPRSSASERVASTGKPVIRVVARYSRQIRQARYRPRRRITSQRLAGIGIRSSVWARTVAWQNGTTQHTDVQSSPCR